MTVATRRIGVNLLWLVPGEVGGSEEYTVRLLHALADAAPADLDIVLYVNGRFSDAHSDLMARFRTRVAPVSGSSRPVRVLAESTWLALRSRLDGRELMHHTGGTMPPVRSVPGIVTLHDLQPIVHPERFGLVKRTYIRLLAPRSMRAARAVVCLTRFTAGDAIDRAGVDAEHIRIVPCGVDDPGAAFDHEERRRVLDELGIGDRPFILYPAITYPHKNHETLIAALAGLVIDRPDLCLVLTGGAGPSEEIVLAAIDAYGLAGDVIRTGRIPERDLDLLYRSAIVMAFPSLYEGFGLPALEAMSRGCAVVASDVGGLPFVLGDAAELIDPIDVNGWIQTLGSVIDDPARRSVLVRRGFERARTFAWPDSAAALVSAYREIR